LLPKYAWYANSSKEQTWPVASLKPNDLGLFDVLALKQAFILGIFVPGREFERGRTVYGQPARTAGEELFGVVHGLGPFLRMSL
jgi:hypothetical protein